MIELSITTLIFLIIAIFSGWWALLKMFFMSEQKSRDAQHVQVKEAIANGQKEMLDIERSFMTFQAEVPRIYMRRDDYSREVSDLKEMIQRELAGVRSSVNRIEDHLIQK